MGMFDEIKVPCPKCKTFYYAQSKGGECLLKVYDLTNCPKDVLSDANRHAPFECEKCHTMFEIRAIPRRGNRITTVEL